MYIKDTYYDVRTGLQSANKFYETFKPSTNKTEFKKDVNEFISNQEGEQLTKRKVVRKADYIGITGPLGSWQLDLMFYDQYATRNKNYGAFLVGIEINTRFLVVIPLKHKDMYNTVLAFGKLYSSVSDDITPVNIMSDNGGEFKNRIMTDLFKELGINQSFAEVNDHHKLGLVDRVIYTIRTLIEKYMAAYNTKQFITVLDDLVYNYNNTPHSNLKNMTPQQAVENIPKTVKIQLEKKGRSGGPVGYKEGDLVREEVVKGKLDKGTTANYDKEVVKVKRVVGNRVELEDGAVVPPQRLQKIKRVEVAPKRSMIEDDTLAKYRHAQRLNKEGIMSFSEAKEAAELREEDEPRVHGARMESLPPLEGQKRTARVRNPINRLAYDRLGGR